MHLSASYMPSQEILIHSTMLEGGTSSSRKQSVTQHGHVGGNFSRRMRFPASRIIRASNGPFRLEYSDSGRKHTKSYGTKTSQYDRCQSGFRAEKSALVADEAPGMDDRIGPRLLCQAECIPLSYSMKRKNLKEIVRYYCHGFLATFHIVSTEARRALEDHHRLLNRTLDTARHTFGSRGLRQEG